MAKTNSAMGRGIAGPSEPGAAGTAGGETAVGGEGGTTSKPSAGTPAGLTEAAAEALDIEG